MIMQNGDYILVNEGKGNFLAKVLEYDRTLWIKGTIKGLILTDPNSKGLFLKEPEEFVYDSKHMPRCSLFYRPNIKVEFFNIEGIKHE